MRPQTNSNASEVHCVYNYILTYNLLTSRTDISYHVTCCLRIHNGIAIAIDFSYPNKLGPRGVQITEMVILTRHNRKCIIMHL